MNLESKKMLSIVAPVYNEQEVIQQFIDRLMKAIVPLQSDYQFEVILVDDGSRDTSLNLMKQAVFKHSCLKIVQLRKNYGQTAALQAGLDQATGDLVVTMDADLQHFPEDIPAFLEKLEQGFDLVCGWRAQRDEGVIRRWPSRMANYFLHKISGLDIHDFGTTFRIYKAEYAKELRLLGESHRYLPILVNNNGGKVSEIPIQNVRRFAGKSNYGLGRIIGVFIDLFLIQFFTHYQDRPLRIFGKIALITFSVGVGLILAITTESFVYGINALQERIGTFMVSIVLLIGSIQIFLSGILAEIMTRVMFSQGDQRVYRIFKTWDADNLQEI
jgi:glycosyltransferase involved in cell wall biosynthesis